LNKTNFVGRCKLVDCSAFFHSFPSLLLLNQAFDLSFRMKEQTSNNPSELTNRTIVRNADAALVQQFGSELAEIRERVAAQLGPIVKTTPAQVTRDMLPKQRLSEGFGLWEVISSGHKISPEKVSSSPTSTLDRVRGGHEILKANFRGDYG
jgi:hypothetical protein